MDKPCRSPHGERGLKSARGSTIIDTGGRSPHGERGLKSRMSWVDSADQSVAPLTGSVD